MKGVFLKKKLRNKTYGLASLLHTFNTVWDRLYQCYTMKSFHSDFSSAKESGYDFFKKKESSLYLAHSETPEYFEFFNVGENIWQRWGRILVFLEIFVFISFTLFFKMYRHKTYTYFKIQSIPWHFLPKFPLVFNMSGFGCYWAFDSFWSKLTSGAWPACERQSYKTRSSKVSVSPDFVQAFQTHFQHSGGRGIGSKYTSNIFEL